MGYYVADFHTYTNAAGHSTAYALEAGGICVHEQKHCQALPAPKCLEETSVASVYMSVVLTTCLP